MKIFKISHVKDENGEMKEIREFVKEVPTPEKEQKVVLITREEIADEICRIPEGRVVPIDDLMNHLESRHKGESIQYEHDIWPLMRYGEWVPYWRVVSPKGFIGQVGYTDRECAEYYLEKEGVPLKPASRSLKIADLDHYRFRFGSEETAC